MKITAMLGAAALAVSSFAVFGPADAQRHGWHDGPHGGSGWDRGHGWDRGRHWDRGHGWDRGRGWGRDWGRGRGWHGDRGYRRYHTGCRGYYGSVRRCFRGYR